MTTTILHNAQLIDGTGGDPVADAVVVIDDGKITWVAKQPLMPLPSMTPRIPSKSTSAGTRSRPVFFDVHVHLSLPGPSGGSPMREAMVPPSFRYFELIGRLKKTLAAGVTTVRDLMGVDVGVRNAVEYGMVEGPRLLAADRMLSQTGGHADWHLASNIDGGRWWAATWSTRSTKSTNSLTPCCASMSMSSRSHPAVGHLDER